MPIDARRVVVRVRVRRLLCPTPGCHQTFREQLPGVLERYQRRTPPSDRADRRGGAGVSRSYRCPSVIRSGRVRLPARGPARAAAPAAAEAADTPCARGGRLRPTSTPALRDRPHRRRDPRADRRPARQSGRHPGGLAARAFRRQGSYAGTAPRPTPGRSAAHCRTRCRWPTAGTSGTTWPKRSSGRSPPTAPAGPRPDRHPRPATTLVPVTTAGASAEAGAIGVRPVLLVSLRRFRVLAFADRNSSGAEHTLHCVGAFPRLTSFPSSPPRFDGGLTRSGHG